MGSLSGAVSAPQWGVSYQQLGGAGELAMWSRVCGACDGWWVSWWVVAGMRLPVGFLVGGGGCAAAGGFLGGWWRVRLPVSC